MSSSEFFPSAKDEALPILKPAEFQLELETLKKILLKKEIANMPVAVISIAGAYRTGKSFILNFFIRYFKANAIGLEAADWLGKSDDDLNEGFLWQSGAKPHTSGILMWSRPFIVEKDGEKIAVILMDTQGNFDHNTEKSLTAQIFALSTLISSVQIFNLKNQIQDNDLEHLKFFVDFANFCRQKRVQKGRKPFQKLLFVVRDWSHLRDYQHGIEGGKDYLLKECHIGTNEGKNSVRKDLHNSFENIDCFLMPYPGPKVDSPDEEFTGKLKDMIPLFQKSVKKLVEHVCKNIAPKTYNGNSLTGKTLLEHIKRCYQIMKDTKFDLNKTVTELLADSVNPPLQDECVTSFKEKMEEELESNVTLPGKFGEKVRAVKEELVQEYKHKFFGSSDCIQSCEEKLLKAMNEKEKDYVYLTIKVNEQLKKANQYIDNTPGLKDLKKIQKIYDEARKKIKNLLGESRKKILETVKKELDGDQEKSEEICKKANFEIKDKAVTGGLVGGAATGLSGLIVGGAALSIGEATVAAVAIASGGGFIIGAVGFGFLCWNLVKTKRNNAKKKQE